MTTPMIGNRVRGQYYGVPFTGIVKSARSHTMACGTSCYRVALDAPITVYGGQRDGVWLEVDSMTLSSDDGSSSISVEG